MMLFRRFLSGIFICLCVFCVTKIKINYAFSDEIRDTRFENQLTPLQKIQLENKKAQALASFAKALNLLESEYIDSNAIDTDKLLEKALVAISSDLDPHTSYLPPNQFKNFVSNEPKPIPKKVEIIAEDLSHNIMYLKLPLFHSNAADEVRKKIIEFKISHEEQINGLVFDLRNNPGGLFDQSVKISNLFIDSGILVSSIGRDKKKPQQVEFALKSRTFEDFPIVVLVNENTASASEILAGALQDRNRAVIMGSRTYGKGSIQRVIPLANGGALKMTVAHYYTPSGRSIQAEGILPDAELLSNGKLKFKNKFDDKILTTAIRRKEINDDANVWNEKLKEDELIQNAYFYLKK